jgi:hypothetical protein
MVAQWHLCGSVSGKLITYNKIIDVHSSLGDDLITVITESPSLDKWRKRLLRSEHCIYKGVYLRA